MAKSSSSAKIVRAIGLFSGVRAVTIICSLVRNKVIAVFAGPAGIGLVILFNSITDLVGSATRLSIDQSIQRDISRAHGHRCQTTISAIRHWAVWLGLLGSAVMCVLSPLLSLWSFDDFDRWWIFCILSVVPFCVTVANCSISINQGLKRLRAVASGTVLGALLGLAVSVPLVIWLNLDSIVWVVTTYGVCALAGAWIFRARIPRQHLGLRQIVTIGRPFLSLGLNITGALFIGQALSYGFILFLNNYASTSQLGIYQAGYTLINTYVGVILTGIWMEYYPRISAMAHSPRRLSVAASHEVSVTMLALIPVLSSFIALAYPIVKLIYSAEFEPVLPFVTIGVVGVLLRATSWCLAYIILARGDGRIYLVTESLSGVIGLGLNIAGYISGGFTGLGISYILWYGTYTAIVATVCHRRYGVSLGKPVVRLVSVAVLTVTAALLSGLYISFVCPLVIAAITAIIAARKLTNDRR